MFQESAADDGYNPTEAKAFTEEELKESTEKFNADISSRMKDKGDLFDEMVVHEEQIRLGEEGWKPRYYQVLDPQVNGSHLELDHVSNVSWATPILNFPPWFNLSNRFFECLRN